MKKTLMTCLAIAALFAIAGSASAITCTIDQRPAATLLVPYFEATFNPDGTALGSGENARDTLVTICNASSAPMIAHVSVWSERTELVLDFNIALTGFDCQAMRMSDVLTGILPRTGFVSGGVLRDACQRNVGSGSTNAKVYPNPNGFIRVLPTNPTSTQDNNLATTILPSPAWPAGSDFAFQVLDSLDETDDSVVCGGIDRVIENPIRGYLTIDHANYCNLSNPSDELYYDNDAIGMENNLFGEVIFTSGTGIPTFGNSTVNIEAATEALVFGEFENQTDTDRARTFYARYWVPSRDPGCNNCIGSLAAGTNLFLNSPWNVAIGDAREPLGLKYAARWFNASGVTSYFNVWRGSASDDLLSGDTQGPLTNLLGTPFGDCDDSLPTVSLVFLDEDENSTTTSCPVSPCSTPTFNFPLETQRRAIGDFSGALPAAAAGWVSMSFFNGSGASSGRFDQAWVEYDFEGPGAFLSAGQPATQLDPSNCNPLGVTGVQTILPIIPSVRGTGP